MVPRAVPLQPGKQIPSFQYHQHHPLLHGDMLACYHVEETWSKRIFCEARDFGIRSEMIRRQTSVVH